MAHELAFSKIHIIEWLWDTNPEDGQPDRRTGKELYGHIRAMIAEAKSPIGVIRHRVGSRRSFVDRLKRIQQDFETTRKLPLLQIETHGDDQGIGLGEDGLEWAELMEALTPLNLATGCWLPVFLSSCQGVWGIRMPQVMRRAPFYALMGPKREVYPTEVMRGLRAFYRKIIVETDGPNAMSHLNGVINPDEDTFRIYNCEQLFRDIWGWYLDGTTVDDVMGPIFEEMLAKRHAERPMTNIEVAELRDYVSKYVRDYHSRFEESRRQFFMIDRVPSNHARFNLVLKETGGTLEIDEA